MTKSNVNRDRYTQAGRERQGEDVVHDKQKQALQTALPGQKEKAPSGAAKGKGARKAR